MSIKALQRLTWVVTFLLAVLAVLSVFVTAFVVCAISDPHMAHRGKIMAVAAAYVVALFGGAILLVYLHLRIAEKKSETTAQELEAERRLTAEMRASIAANVRLDLDRQETIRILRGQLGRVTEEAERLTLEIDRRDQASRAWRANLFEPRDTKPTN